MKDLQNAVVMASFSVVGIQDKESRGVVPEQAELPAALVPVQSALQRMAARLGVDLSQTGDALRASFEKALANSPAVLKPAVSQDHGLSLG